MLPTRTDVHIDKALTNISLAFEQGESSFIARRAAPVVGVEHRTDKYFTYDRSYFWFDEGDAARRADGAPAREVGYAMSTDDYSVEVRALKKPIPVNLRANADASIDLDRDAVRFLTQKALVSMEVAWAAAYFATSKWTTDKTGGTDFTKWSTVATSDPIVDIGAGRLKIQTDTGLMPNTLIVNPDVDEVLKRHPIVTERFKYTSSDSISNQMLARLFEVDNYLVMNAVKQTSIEGKTASYSFVGGKNALLCYVAPTPGPYTPSAMYTFAWEGVDGELRGTRGLGARTWFDADRKADMVELEWNYAFKVVSKDLGYFFSTAV